MGDVDIAHDILLGFDDKMPSLLKGELRWCTDRYIEQVRQRTQKPTQFAYFLTVMDELQRDGNVNQLLFMWFSFVCFYHDYRKRVIDHSKDVDRLHLTLAMLNQTMTQFIGNKAVSAKRSQRADLFADPSLLRMCTGPELRRKVQMYDSVFSIVTHACMFTMTH